MPYKIDPKTGSITYVPGEGNDDKSAVVKGDPAATEDQIKATTDNLTEENSNDVFGRGKAKGDFRLRKYSRAQIIGTSKSFEGTYFISEVTHTITTNGYEVDFAIKTKQSAIGFSSGSSGDVTKSPAEQAGRQPESPSSGSTSGGMKLDPKTGTWQKA